MAHSKPPPSRKSSKRPPPRPAPHEPSSLKRDGLRPHPRDDTRLAQCETAVVALHADVEALRAEVQALRLDLGHPGGRARKRPPPLPAGGDEVIIVDEGEVVLGSIRPPHPRR